MAAPGPGSRSSNSRNTARMVVFGSGPARFIDDFGQGQVIKTRRTGRGGRRRCGGLQHFRPLLDQRGDLAIDFSDLRSIWASARSGPAVCFFLLADALAMGVPGCFVRKPSILTGWERAVNGVRRVRSS